MITYSNNNRSWFHSIRQMEEGALPKIMADDAFELKNLKMSMKPIARFLSFRKGQGYFVEMDFMEKWKLVISFNTLLEKNPILFE